METRRKIRLSLALSIVVAAAIPASNCLTNSLVGVMFPTPVPSSSNGSSSSNHQTTAPSAVSAAAIHQVESKRMEQWSPSPPDLSHHMQQHQPPQQPQTSYGLPSYSQQPVHNSQPFMPANYYLPVNDEPTIGNNYGTAAATEFRSDHYPYPFDPPTAYAYPIAAQPQVDTSLIPTAKHFVIVSFIGLLLLFAIIQNSIAAAKRKDALVEVLSNRRKRELDEANYQLLVGFIYRYSLLSFYTSISTIPCSLLDILYVCFYAAAASGSRINEKGRLTNTLRAEKSLPGKSETPRGSRRFWQSSCQVFDVSFFFTHPHTLSALFYWIPFPVALIFNFFLLRTHTMNE
ncbi:unnamed protein product [Trichogramma brassicae]|uniref:Uncharacterized protein n=1 Tax=Trichogramma brassicae TaxID=86971 RepID=A0A6H5I6B2_9HYME|nr:unnamed protein product [Trichogramma brassicae]